MVKLLKEYIDSKNVTRYIKHSTSHTATESSKEYTRSKVLQILSKKGGVSDGYSTVR